MRYYFSVLLALTFISCTKNRDQEPRCKFKQASHRAGFQYPVTYRGDTLIIWGENTTGSSIYFSTPGRLHRIESPVTDPYIRTELEFNNKDKVLESKTYFKVGNNWVYQNKMVFSYTNNKITNIREEHLSNTSGPFYNTDVVWDGDNIQTVINRMGRDTSCIKTFSYDMSRTNPMIRHSYLYFGDGDADYGGYKLPFYFSKNLVTKVESNCGTRVYSYVFNSNGLLEKMLDNSDTLWTYEYNCQ